MDEQQQKKWMPEIEKEQNKYDTKIDRERERERELGKWTMWDIVKNIQWEKWMRKEKNKLKSIYTVCHLGFS